MTRPIVSTIASQQSGQVQVIERFLLLLLSRRFLSLLVLAEVAAIVWFAFVGGNLQDDLQHLLSVNDHVMHMAAFACAGVTALLLWSPLRATVLLTCGAMSIELVQRFIPGRESSLADLGASLGGVVIGGLAAWFVIAVLLPLMQPAVGPAIRRN